MESYDILIIGAGIAGMAAAEGCSSLRTLMVDRGEKPGGVLLQCLHRGFGWNYTGPEYAEKIAGKIPGNVELRFETTVLEIRKNKTAVLSSAAGGLQEIEFKQLILAVGCRERAIGQLPVAGTRPEGIYTAGELQRKMNLLGKLPDGPVVILGSGDLGLIVAGQLHQAGIEVLCIVEQKDRCGAMAKTKREYLAPYPIKLVCSATITQVYGEETLMGVKIRDLMSGAEQTVSCRTLAVAVGLVPDTTLTDKLGQPEWLNLCGNCSKVHKLVESVAAEGKIAAEAALRKLRDI